ncbi:methylated-DNA--[protein]-cysteine S-methyltransferase [Campylobacter hyointestinalis]|uniref:methylated-DNA--[protein]-cysteine S-methyltransferase n=1 Tax=Campylobacter hyointestinalis TaxID=198 RepID=UPI0025522025|nr:methylated-DNA--[protein]-cysteine S-methyltransferase [Campylobacter hyointestinalis]MDL2346864.1 methylated-DNA--[protein]-cysteine S-methyltransferase [Campylobacter hyointestinalis]MDL2348525.1 methylated-DNA--[protein]-cysteine S-methyltransferase [Campylobacter hyointestinalis]MDL2350350.1 methylated-DNA--[protein]-cysteine S-methyltransferase [Campylobacter hyointestinalis]MDM1026101.1 methylated-DNA--[protein]-cysteine S-methyltransferase [Campylobacter hyointestinalis]MDM1027276.1 
METAYIKSPIGNLKITDDDGEIIRLDFCDEFIDTSITNKNLKLCVDELNLYFQGKLKTFKTKIKLSGTEFEQKVYKALLKIPYGKTATYKDIAINLGLPKAARAVGNANGKNKIPIIVPCHRVVSVTNLGGYSGGNGLETKKSLLNLEKVYL